MKKNMTWIAASLCTLSLLSGCSWMNNEDKKVEDTKREVSDNAKDMENKSSAKIDDMMKYLEEEGMEFSEVKTLDKMDFAASEGRSFMYNGSSAYLYNLNTQDAGMKALIQDVGKHKRVKVKQGDEEKEYGAMVNGSYLFIYDKEADMKDMLKTFPKYQYKQ